MRQKLISLRKCAKCTQGQIARELNVTERHYRQYEAGTTDGSLRLWQQLADKFGTSIDAIVENLPSARTEEMNETQGNCNTETKHAKEAVA